MPSDSNGVYSLPASYFVQNGDTVLPVQHNPPFEDVANALTNRIMKDGRTVMTGDLQMGGNRPVGRSDKFDTVAQLLASQIHYGNGPWGVQAGRILEAQGFRYEVADVSATDAHIEVGQGVKLYLRPLGGSIWVNATGADTNGVVNSAPAFVAAARAAEEQGCKLEANGDEFYWSGPAPVFTTDVDFHGTPIRIAEVTGKVTFKRQSVPVTYDVNSDVVADLRTSTDLNQGSVEWSGWAARTDIQDCFITVNTNQPMYYYRNQLQLGRYFNRHTRDGMMTSPLQYTVPSATIQSVVVIPVPEGRKRYQGLVFDIRGYDGDGYRAFIDVADDLFDMDLRIMQPAEPLEANLQVVEFTGCNMGRVRLYAPWPMRQVDGEYTYGASIGDCYDCTFEVVGAGDGWGFFGNGLNAKLKFINTEVNRIDFHRPCMESCTVIDCTLGRQPLVMSLMGDLIVERPRFIGGASHLIVGRGDHGRFCDGKLIVRDATLTTSRMSGQIDFMRCNISLNSSPKPEGSPVNYRFFSSVLVDGFTVERPAGSTFRVNITPTFLATGGSVETLSPASEVVLKNLKGAIFTIMGNLQAITPQFDGDNFLLSVEDSSILGISLTGTGDNFNFVANFDNVRGLDGGAAILEITQKGNYTINGGVLDGIKFQQGESGPLPAHPVSVRAFGTKFKKQNGSSPLQGVNGNVGAALYGCSFHWDTDSELYSVLGALLVDPAFYVAGSRTELRISNDLSGSVGTWTLVSSPVEGQKAVAVFNHSAGKSSQTEFRMPLTGNCADITGRLAGSGPANVNLDRTGATSIIVSGNSSPRFLKVG